MSPLGINVATEDCRSVMRGDGKGGAGRGGGRESTQEQISAGVLKGEHAGGGWGWGVSTWLQ